MWDYTAVLKITHFGYVIKKGENALTISPKYTQRDPPKDCGWEGCD